MKTLTAERGLVFRITHHNNLAWILKHGLHCKNSSVRDPNFVEIGRPEIISRRANREVDCAPGGKLSDYIPFYFTPRTPMLYNIKTGWKGLTKRPMNEIVVLVACLNDLIDTEYALVIADRNASLEFVHFQSGLTGLSTLPWALWQASDFTTDQSRPDKIDRYHAEALVHQHLLPEHLKAVGCYTQVRSAEIAELVAKRNLELPVIHRPGWYF